MILFREMITFVAFSIHPYSNVHMAPVVQKVGNPVYQVHGGRYPLDNTIGFPKTYPVDSDLIVGKLLLNNRV